MLFSAETKNDLFFGGFKANRLFGEKHARRCSCEKGQSVICFNFTFGLPRLAQFM